MPGTDKMLARMRANPRDWRIEDLKTVARRYNVSCRQPGTSHVTFRALNGAKVTVPARKPIKPVYVRQFVALIESLGAERDA
jgi:hypothetical protein